MRRTAPISSLPRSRKRPRCAALYPPSCAPPARAKRMCVPRTPSLPLDVWHNVASHLPPAALANLAATGSQWRPIAVNALHRKLWHALFPNAAYDARQAAALARVLSLLCAAPSMRAKRVGRQIALMCRLGDAYADLLLPVTVCFTKNHAARFLHVDACHLSKLPLAKVTTRSSTRHFPALHLPHVYSYLDTERKGPSYPLASILRAALATHCDLHRVIPHLRKAVRDDERCYHRAVIADSLIHTLASKYRFGTEQLDYCLEACAQVKEFRRGAWEKDYEQYAPLVTRLVQLHSSLEPCYRFLLKTDGHARLKAKRLITKLMRMGSFCVPTFARTLQANLWWARSDENLAKMKREMRKCHVTRSRASTVAS